MPPLEETLREIFKVAIVTPSTCTCKLFKMMFTHGNVELKIDRNSRFV